MSQSVQPDPLDPVAATPAHARPRTMWRRRLLVVVIGALAALGIAELLLRHSFGHFLGAVSQMRGMFVQEDGFLQLAPGYRGELIVAGHPTTIEINSVGLWGPEIPPPTPDEFRILCLGDSMVMGYGVDGAQAFTALLESALNERFDRRIRVGNAGTPSHGTIDQEASLRHRQVSFKPDLVVSFVFLGNDFEDDLVRERSVVAGYMVLGPMKRLLDNSWRARLALRSRVAFATERFFDRYLPAIAIDKTPLNPTPEEQLASLGLPPLANRSGGYYLDRRVETPAIAKALDRTIENLKNVRDLADPFPHVVVILPALGHTSAALHSRELERIGLDPADYRHRAIQERLLARCEAGELKVLDLTHAFMGHANPERLFIEGDGHLSPGGHGFVTPILSALLSPLIDP